jgi:mannose-6-phosphate isomerase-like protein (cupin superfamily)
MGQIETFRFEPAAPRRKKPAKAYFDLLKTDAVKVELQIVEEGGENRMHSHPYLDGIWYVLRGRARFYDVNDQPVEVGADEGVHVPHGTRYWYETASDEPLHILLVAVQTPNTDSRTRHHIEYHDPDEPALTDEVGA